VLIYLTVSYTVVLIFLLLFSFSGQSQDFQISVKSAKDFPVDIYFLNDLSHSMAADLENLQKLANNIGKDW